ncbi:hypothetical protein SO802_029450 [Lithocarpus litseifolius]|uniref:Uncharacterized protein n=1 Tax=Lithocarpus litseifolius TaxID=425828 RepID=A0AAW2BTN6_9ROSI
MKSLCVVYQKVSTQATSASSSSGKSLGAEISASSQSQQPWPRMSPTEVQKYTKVFLDVDKDRDGRITGVEARNLFLSWRLPREVLKQVWDLADQDDDSMLSHREFCVALYLMERYREGTPLPAVLPSSIISDLPTPGQPMTNYSNAAWGHAPGTLPHHESFSLWYQLAQFITKYILSLPFFYYNICNALQNIVSFACDIVMITHKKNVLYKSRCANRLNEITERASADKREVESLAKKYEEKYKQSGDVASKLTIEEATFRDLQERKMELYQAIVKMEQDGSADGVLQVHADRIQSDLDELVKGLNERCKKYGLRAKPTTLTELPFGERTMSCFGCCEENDIHKAADTGPFTANNSAVNMKHAGNNGGYAVKEAVPKDKQTLTMQPIAVPAIPVEELKAITDNFGTKALIGEGSYGRVYHGVLNGGQTAAIKKLDSSKQPDQEFLAKVLQELKNENVVELVGYCVDGSLRVLEYEYAPNGSLHDILHGRKGVKGAQPGPVLSWAQRVKIAVGAAKGLEYLHEKAQPHIVHRDIKSSNILLFDADVAKIADFDLSNEAPDNAARLHSTRVLGTFGYHAPA